MDEQNTAQPLNMEVTARPIEPVKNLVGFASVTFNNCFVVTGFKIFNGENGIFAAMPSKPDKSKEDGGFRDTAFPITKEFRAELIGAIATAYHAEVEKAKSAETPSIKDEMANAKKEVDKENNSRPASEKGKDKGDR